MMGAMVRSPAVSSVFVSVGGLRLHHLDHGGSGEPIVLVHGVTGHAAAWHAVAPHLTDLGRPLAVELRGHGDSQWSAAGDYATTDHVADLVAVLDALGHEQVTVVGSAWGALVAIGVASMHPARVGRLAVVDVEASFEAGETDVFPRPRAYPDHAAAVAHERKANPHAPDDLLGLVAAGGTRPGPDGTLVPKHDPFFFERWPFRRDDWWDALGTIAAPTLLVHAGESFVRGEVMADMAARIADARLVAVAASTHVVPVDAPASLVEALRSFLGA